ncbi:MAG: PCI domain-containing protein [Promethearchaeota archaeon]
MISVNKKLNTSLKVLKHEEESSIKQNILDLGTQFTQLELQDIAERCFLNQEKVDKILNKMIANKEIFAKYNSETKVIQLDQDINIEEIDKLMQIYKKWESDAVGKKLDERAFIEKI